MSRSSIRRRSLPRWGRRLRTWLWLSILRGARKAIKHHAVTWPSLAGLGAWPLCGVLYLAGASRTVTFMVIVAAVSLAGWEYWTGRLLTRAAAMRWPALAAAGVWVACATAYGPWRTPWIGIWLLGVVGGQIAWVRLRKHLSLQKAQEAKESNMDALTGDPVPVVTWRLQLACAGGAFPKSQLANYQELPNGWQATVKLDPVGDQVTSTVAEKAARIAKVYNVPRDLVGVEAGPGGDESTAVVQVLRTNPLMKTKVYSGATLDPATGLATIGVHKDGNGAAWQLWQPGSGVCHGLGSGTTGAGKSGLLMQLCAEILQSDRALLFLCDPENGESVKDFATGADCFGGTIPRIRHVLQSAERIMKVRKRQRGSQWHVDQLGRSRRGIGSFTPTPETPAVFCVIDEAPDVLADKECARIIAAIGKKGRKLGVAVIIFTQIPSLSELGGDLAVRSMLSSTNVVIFRTSDRLSKHMGSPVPLPIDPATLPTRWPDGSSTAGLGFIARAGAPVSEMRCGWVDDPYKWAIEVPQRCGRPALPAAEVECFAGHLSGNYWQTWREILDVDDEDIAEMTGVAGSPQPVEAPRVDESSSRHKILAALTAAERPMTTGALAEASGLKKLSATSTALARLRDKGLVQKHGHGQWEITEEGCREVGAAA